jgi:hypothetical protein
MYYSIYLSRNYIRGDFMDQKGIPAVVTAVAEILASKLTEDELALLAAILTQLGDTLTTLLTLKQISEGENGGNPPI